MRPLSYPMIAALTLVAPLAHAWSSVPGVDDPISGGLYTHTVPAIVGDGAGGVIVAWDYGGGKDDIRAQQLDANGDRIWSPVYCCPSGVPVCVASGVQSSVRIASDAAGGAIVVWLDARSGTKVVYAQ